MCLQKIKDILHPSSMTGVKVSQYQYRIQDGSVTAILTVTWQGRYMKPVYMNEFNGVQEFADTRTYAGGGTTTIYIERGGGMRVVDNIISFRLDDAEILNITETPIIAENVNRITTYASRDAVTSYTVHPKIGTNVSAKYLQRWYDPIEKEWIEDLITVSSNGQSTMELTGLSGYVATIYNISSQMSLGGGYADGIEVYDTTGFGAGNLGFSLDDVQVLDLTNANDFVGYLKLSNTKIKSLDLSTLGYLSTFLSTNNNSIKEIRTKATKEQVAGEVTRIIRDNAKLHGTVYTNRTDPYFSIIETAANTYGWTIKDL